MVKILYKLKPSLGTDWLVDMFSVLIKSKGTISKEAGKNISPRTDYFIFLLLSFLRFLSVPS